MREVRSSSSAARCTTASGIQSTVVYSCSERRARLRTKPAKHRGAQSDAGDEGYRQGGIRAKTGHSREHPEDLIERHQLIHQACACAAQYAVASPGPSSSAVFATTSASQPVAATHDTSSNPLWDGTAV